ncbi:MAG: Bbp16 family capsid cement protein [Syntrophobacteraceae bacterium]
MIMDSLAMFDGGLSATGVFTGTSVVSGTTFTSAAATDSANILDLSQIAGSAAGRGRDIGIGDDPELKIAIEVMTAFAGAGASMQIELQTAPDNGSGSPGTWAPINMTPVIPVASLVPGQINTLEIVPGVQKFLKLTYVVTGANMTAGAIASGIVLDRGQLGPNLGYPSGYSNQYV